MPDRARVTLSAPEPFVSLGLLDARLSPVPLPYNLGSSDVELAPGAYLAQFSTSNWHSEEAFLVLPGRQKT